MREKWWLAMIAVFIICGITFAATAQEESGGGLGLPGERQGAVDKGSNGQPSAGKVDQAAVDSLSKAEQAMSKDGEEQQAISLALPLIETFRSNEDYDHLAECLSLIGEAYYYLGDWANAEKYMSQAADVGFRYFPDDMSTFPLKVIGESQFQQKKYDESLATFQRRVQLLRKMGDTVELPSSLFDVGGVLINLNREAEAVPVLQEAETAVKARAAELAKPGSGATPEDRNGNTVDHAEILYHLAIAEYHQDKLSEALGYLNQAYKLFKSIDESGLAEVQDRLVAVLDDLVLVNERLGNTNDADAFRAERDALNK